MIGSPEVKNVPITDQYVGQIQAQRHIRIRALQKGYLETVPVKEGQVVRKGELVFKIVPELYKARLDAELAEVRVVELELQNAERSFQNKVVGANEVNLIKSKVDKARAKAELVRAELNFTEIRSPFDGLIDRLHEQQGSLIEEGETLTTLSDNHSMWVYFNVPEARYLDLAVTGKEKEGKVELVLANGNKFKESGKISAFEAKFDNDTGTIPFRADFPNPDGRLRHGMTGTVLIHRMLNHAVVIPQRASFEVLDKRYVYVVDKQDVAHRREIVVRSEFDDSFVIGRGVGAEDQIIVEGTQQVRDGEKVK